MPPCRDVGEDVTRMLRRNCFREILAFSVPCLPPGEYFEYTPMIRVTFAWSIRGKIDIIYETGSIQRILTPPEGNRASTTGKLHVKFSEVLNLIFEMWSLVIQRGDSSTFTLEGAVERRPGVFEMGGKSPIKLGLSYVEICRF